MEGGGRGRGIIIDTNVHQSIECQYKSQFWVAEGRCLTCYEKKACGRTHLSRQFSVLTAARENRSEVFGLLLPQSYFSIGGMGGKSTPLKTLGRKNARAV